MWDSAMEVYPNLGARPLQSAPLRMVFPSGAKVTFTHLQLDKTVYDWQGSQVPLICFDELTHFSQAQFFYMLSRNRSLCGVKPYVRATCNPDADSWVASFISWWINQDTGYPIPERSGVLRYFIRISGEIKWGDTKAELQEKYAIEDEREIKSVTFISSSIYDNKILLEKNPEYLGSLKAMPLVERERLLGGNWKIRPSGGMIFNRAQARIVTELSSKVVRVVRAWDLAATIPTQENQSPDATAGVALALLEDQSYAVLDLVHGRWLASQVRSIVKNTAQSDRATYRRMRIRLSQDPGQAGKAQAESYIRELAGFSVTAKPESGDKVTRAEPVSSQWQRGNIYILAAPWNEKFIAELEGFPEAEHDDIVDALSNAFNELTQRKPMKIDPKLVQGRR